MPEGRTEEIDLGGLVSGDWPVVGWYKVSGKVRMQREQKGNWWDEAFVKVPDKTAFIYCGRRAKYEQWQITNILFPILAINCSNFEISKWLLLPHYNDLGYFFQPSAGIG